MLLTATPVLGAWAGQALGSRYECKYLVDEGVVPLLRAFIRPFVRPDGFSLGHEGHRYPICSLYLDSPDLSLCRQTLTGEKNRFKLRIRSYSDSPEDPVFLEIKRRVDGVILKRRIRLPRFAVEPLLANGSSSQASEFSMLTRATGASPVLRVKYLREAYESATGEPVRLTMDTCCRYRVTPGLDLAHDDGDFSPTPVAGTILELKFTDRFPPWVADLVRTFELRRRSVAKYALSMQHAVQTCLYHPLRPLGPECD